MKKTNIFIMSLYLCVSILPSVALADVIDPDADVFDISSSPGADVVDTGSSSTDLLIIIAAIIGIISLIAWKVIRKIKKNHDSEGEPEIRA